MTPPEQWSSFGRWSEQVSLGLDHIDNIVAGRADDSDGVLAISKAGEAIRKF